MHEGSRGTSVVEGVQGRGREGGIQGRIQEPVPLVRSINKEDDEALWSSSQTSSYCKQAARWQVRHGANILHACSAHECFLEVERANNRQVQHSSAQADGANGWTLQPGLHRCCSEQRLPS